MPLSISHADAFSTQVAELQPQWAMVLGSGLAPLLEEVEIAATLSYEEVPGLPPSRVPGHAGRFVLGRLAGVPVIVAQGRVHLYEGYSAKEVTGGIRQMITWGARRVLLTNAAGTLHPKFLPGEWMMLNDHLNLTGTTPLLGGANFIDMTTTYAPAMRAHFSSAAAAEATPLHEGVYAGLLGPQYETPAEVRMLRTLGADAVGMSTVLEAIQARALGAEVVAFSCLTNWAAGIGAGALHHEEVLITGREATAAFQRLIRRALPAAA
ncbi:MAG TPA: purine-nucleoside phosphorylase [Chthoniobacteraceae bacterium]